MVCWCIDKSSNHQNIRCGNGWIALRSGCIEFLTTLVEKYNVGIWSTTLKRNVEPIISALQSISNTTLSFFFVWYQEQCEVYSNGRIYRPDKLGVEAMFKPLSTLGGLFKSDARRTLLIDDSPYKGSVNPQENCIYPPTFNRFKNDDFLVNDLLPYLHRLIESIDIRTIVKENQLG